MYRSILSSLLTLHCVNISAVVRVDAEIIEFPDDKIIEHEDRIDSQWKEVSAGEQHKLRKKIDKVLRPLGLQTRLLVVERANSIALYFFCMTFLAVTSLRDLWRSGQLRNVVTSLFTFLAGTDVYVKKLTWPVSDYERCLDFFSCLQGWSTIQSEIFTYSIAELRDVLNFCSNYLSHWYSVAWDRL